jgi:hypothetical protein
MCQYLKFGSCCFPPLQGGEAPFLDEFKYHHDVPRAVACRIWKESSSERGRRMSLLESWSFLRCRSERRAQLAEGERGEK